jgi:CRISPR-associated endonuclease/helicase Cas3
VGEGRDAPILLAAAIATHHKDLSELSENYLGFYDPEDDPLQAMLDEVRPSDMVALHGWLRTCGRAWIEALGMAELGVSLPPLPRREIALRQVSAGRIRYHLEQVQAWLALVAEAGGLDGEAGGISDLGYSDSGYSNAGNRNWRTAGVLLRGGLVQADHLASAGSGELPTPRGLVNHKAWLESAGLSWEGLYAHQRACASAPPHTLLCAPTGSGKTEAALLWAGARRRARLFYTLPYQASMNAMYDRLQALFPGQVGLLHGRSLLSLYQRWMDQEYTPLEATRLARLGRNLAGMAYYPLRVLSPYQMLKAAFQLKGYEALLTDFAQAAFIFDEVHAYEPGRLAMIAALMRLLSQEYGACFLVLSATLPLPARQRLGEALPGLRLVQAEPALYQAFTRHRLHLLDGDLLQPENLERAIQAYRAGQQALVVCNTVGRAQQAFQALREAHLPSEDVYLLHGRFHGGDRARIEGLILQRAGLGQGGRRPLILVATQVVEVSLNLDFDVLFSDPAPLEALWQRFGRVNRQRRVGLAEVYVRRATPPNPPLKGGGEEQALKGEGEVRFPEGGGEEQALETRGEENGAQLLKGEKTREGTPIPVPFPLRQAQGARWLSLPKPSSRQAQAYPPYEAALVQQTLDLLEQLTRHGALCIAEDRVQEWLETVYSGEPLAKWQAEYGRVLEEFQQAFLQPLRPFQAYPGLADTFERLFDGLEVLPLCLHDDYQVLRQSDRALEAAQLLVPIRWGQYHALANDGRVLPNERGEPPLVDAEYGETGLRFD